MNFSAASDQPDSASAASPFAPPPEPPRSPRLGIGHLLLWTGCTAVLLGMQKGIAALYAERGDMQQQSLDVALGGIYAILYGPFVASLFIGIARWRRGIAFPTEPGEWLLIVGGLNFLVSMVGRFLILLLDLQWMAFPASIPWVIGGVAYFLAAFLPQLKWRWRVVLLMMGSRYAIVLSYFLLAAMDRFMLFGGAFRWWWLPETANTALNFLMPITLIVAVVIDFRNSISRSWLHWVGVLGVGTSCLLMILNWAWHTFFAQMMN